MKRKKNHPDKFERDKYQDGPKKPVSPKLFRSFRDDDDLDEALEEWSSKRKGRHGLYYLDEEE